MREAPRKVWSLLKETVREWDEDNASRLAAALACYSLLSIAPLVILSVAVAGLIFGADAARGQIASELGRVVGEEAGRAIQTILAHAKSPSSGIAGSILGVVVLLLGASGVFVELQGALNTIWEVKPKPGRGVAGILRDRFFSFAMVLAVAFLLMVSLVVSAGLSAAGRFFEEYLPGGEPLWQILNFCFSLAVTTSLFALIYKVIPDAHIAWRDVWIGALVTAILFNAGKLALALYIGKSGVTSSFGAAGSLVALVVWVYYSSQIVFLGAEFTQVYARRRGNRIEPTANALPDDSKAPRREQPV